MLNGEIVVATLKEILKRTDASVDARLREVAETAHRRINCGGEFPSQLVMSALLGALKTRRIRLIEASVVCVQYLLQARVVLLRRYFTKEAHQPCFSPMLPPTSPRPMRTNNPNGSVSSSTATTMGQTQQQQQQIPLQFGGWWSGSANEHPSLFSVLLASSMSSSPQLLRHSTIGGVVVDTIVEVLMAINEPGIQLKLLEILTLMLDWNRDDDGDHHGVHPPCFPHPHLDDEVSHGSLTAAVLPQSQLRSANGDSLSIRASSSPTGLQPSSSFPSASTAAPAATERASYPTSAAVAASTSSLWCDQRLMSTLDILFRLSVVSTHPGVQASTSSALTTLIRYSVHTFVSKAKISFTGPVEVAIALDAPISDFVVDVLPEEPYSKIAICALPVSVPESPSVDADETKSAPSPSCGADDGRLSVVDSDAFTFQTSHATLDEDHLPLRDLISLVKGLCYVSSRGIPSTNADENSEQVRSRLLGLKLLYLLFDELPIANSEAEHSCAHWVSLLLGSCKYELLKTLSRNVACIAPMGFFTMGVDILGVLLHKVHYPLHKELHSLLNIVLFPLMQSKFSNANQKLSFLSLIRSLLSKPHLIVSYFINYDCSPTFDVEGRYGGLLESIMETLVELPYVAYQEEDWFSEDQQSMLTTEVIRIMHDFVTSLKRWVYDDPTEYAKKHFSRNGGVAQRQGSTHNDADQGRIDVDPTSAAAAAAAAASAGGGDHTPETGVRLGAHGRHLATELYMDSWSMSEDDSTDEDEGEEVDPHNGSAHHHIHVHGGGDGGTHDSVTDQDGNNTSLLSEAVSLDVGDSVHKRTAPAMLTAAALPSSVEQQPEQQKRDHRTVLLGGSSPKEGFHFDQPQVYVFGKKKLLPYHWKHVHLSLRNKRILQEAAARTNVNWRRGRTYLVEQHALSGDDDVQGFVQFLRHTPSIHKGVFCTIFERVNKDKECATILEYYLKTFDYAGLPIDVALRDTTCAFMSWDRPQFEAQVWERIQGLFGAEYAAQNETLISHQDADVMAGVLLFLHTSLHNSNVKGSSKMTLPQFIRDGGACMEKPLSDEEMTAMYERTSRKKWALDQFERTPRQQELAERRCHNALVIHGNTRRASPAATGPHRRLSSGGAVMEASSMSLRRPTLISNSSLDHGSLAPSPPLPSSSTTRRSTTAGLETQQLQVPDNALVSDIVAMGSPASNPDETDKPPSTSTPADAAMAASCFAPPAVAPPSSATTTTVSNNSTTTISDTVLSQSQNVQPPSSRDSSTTNGGGATTTNANLVMAEGSRIFETHFDSYTDNMDRFRHKVEHEQLYVRVANQQLAKLEAEHRRQTAFEVDEAHRPPQPYLEPHYAQHVRQIFLSFYPHVVAACYVGLRQLKQEPILRLILDIYQNLYDIAAAFCINITPLQTVTEKLIQSCLKQESAIELHADQVRGSITPYLMNRI